MTETIGYETALTFIHAYEKKEIQMYGKMNNLTTEVEQLEEEMARIQRLLTQLNRDTDDSKRVDWRHDPVKQQLIDALKENDSTRYLVDGTDYAWKDDQVTHLTENLNNHITRLISPKMQQKMNQVTDSQHILHDALTPVSNAVRECLELIRKIQSKMRAG